MFGFCMDQYGVYMYTTVAVQWNICTMWKPYLFIGIKYVYSAPCHMVDCSDIKFSIYMCIHFPYKPMTCLVSVAYMPNFVVIAMPSTYLATT